MVTGRSPRLCFKLLRRLVGWPFQAVNTVLFTYYSSQAIAQVGGETWNQVYPQLANTLMKEQARNGSWPRSTGSERAFGPTYSSSLAILALTPPYQLLPIYQR
jgi:hypothetical protein